MFRIPVMCKVQGPFNPKCNIIRIQNLVLCDSISTGWNHTLVHVNTVEVPQHAYNTGTLSITDIHYNEIFFKFSV